MLIRYNRLSVYHVKCRDSYITVYLYIYLLLKLGYTKLFVIIAIKFYTIIIFYKCNFSFSISFVVKV